MSAWPSSPHRMIGANGGRPWMGFGGGSSGAAGESRLSRRGQGDCRGFTLVELIMVVVLAGIVGAVVLSRARESGAVLAVQTEVLKSRLRYAQSRAMNGSEIWGISFNGGSYALFRGGNAARVVRLPGEEQDLVTLPEGIVLGSGVVAFDTWGVPYTDAAGTQRQFGLRSLTVVGAGASRTITVTPNTGYVP